MLDNAIKELLLREIGFSKTQAIALLDTSNISDEELANKTEQVLSLQKRRIEQILNELKNVNPDHRFDESVFGDSDIQSTRKEIKKELKNETTAGTDRYGEKVTELLKQLGEMHSKKIPRAFALKVVRQLQDEGFSFLYHKGYGEPIPDEYAIANRIGGPGTGQYFADVLSHNEWFLKVSWEVEEKKKSSPKEKLKYDQMAKVVRKLADLGAFTPKTAVEYNVLQSFPTSLIDEMMNKGLLQSAKWKVVKGQFVYEKVYLLIDSVWFEY